MPRLTSVPIRLTIAERRALRLIRDFHPSKRHWVRADIVLRAAAGQTNLFIAGRLGISRNTVKHWRYRFAREALAGLKTRPIPGRPKKIVTAPPSQSCGDPTPEDFAVEVN